MPKRCTTHQYRKLRQKPSDRLIYRCMNCAHYITPEFLLGRESICWGCKKEFTIDQYSSERTYPKCEECRTRVTPFTKPPEESLGPSSIVNEELPESSNVVADILKRYGI